MIKAKNKLSDAVIVAEHMAKLDHPLKSEINAVRKIIKTASNKIAERIKWNAPSYYYKEDIVTFNTRIEKYVHLVFHFADVVKIKSDLLQGDYKDRRMAYFIDMKSVKSNKKELQRIINELVNFIDNK